MSVKRRLRGKFYPSKGSVFVRVELSQTKASFARFGESIFNLGLQVTNTHQMTKTPRAYASAMVKIPIEHIDELKSFMGNALIRYQSPTFFSHGFICPIYASPEDEINHICTQAYMRFLEKEEAKP